MIRFGEPFIDVAAVEFEMGAQVRAVDGLQVGEIGETGRRQLDRVVNQHRARLERVVNAEHRRQLFIIDFDQFERRFGGIDGQCRHRRHRIADMAHLLRRDDGLILEHRPVKRLYAFVVQDIIARQHRHDTGNLLSLARVDARNPRMRIRTAENFPVHHSRHAHVRQVLRPSGHFGFVIEPAIGFADCSGFHFALGKE